MEEIFGEGCALQGLVDFFDECAFVDDVVGLFPIRIALAFYEILN